jgi:hypothetical protein
MSSEANSTSCSRKRYSLLHVTSEFKVWSVNKIVLYNLYGLTINKAASPQNEINTTGLDRTQHNKGAAKNIPSHLHTSS